MELVTLLNQVGDTSGDIVRAVVFDCRGKRQISYGDSFSCNVKAGDGRIGET